MEHLKSTLRYFKSKSALLFLIAAIPCAMAPFLVSPSSLIYIICQWQPEDYSDYAQLFSRMIGVNPHLFWIGIIGVVLIVFSYVIIFGAIDRHMRTGELNLTRFKTRFNYNFLTALRYSLALFFILESFNVVNLGFCILWARICKSIAFFYVLCALSFIILSALLILVFSLILLWAPCMLHMGLSSWSAFKMGVRQSRGHILKTGVALSVSIFPFFALMILNALVVTNAGFAYLVDVITFMFITVFYSGLMYTVYYKVMGLERMDLQKEDKNIWSRKFMKKSQGGK